MEALFRVHTDIDRDDIAVFQWAQIRYSMNSDIIDGGCDAAREAFVVERTRIAPESHAGLEHHVVYILAGYTGLMKLVQRRKYQRLDAMLEAERSFKLTFTI